MKNFLVLLVALVMVSQARATLYTVKFVTASANNNEPRERSYDQNCQLVNASTGAMIQDNTVILHIGDRLQVNCPVQPALLSSDYEYCLNKDEDFKFDSFDSGDYQPAYLNALAFDQSASSVGTAYYYTDFIFRAKALGVDSLDVYFMKHLKYRTGADYRRLGNQLGHIEVQVVDSSTD